MRYPEVSPEAVLAVNLEAGAPKLSPLSANHCECRC
jgi:hypothetical protein